MSSKHAVIADGYTQFLVDLKTRITTAQVQANRVLNTALVDLYWNIGHRMLEE